MEVERANSDTIAKHFHDIVREADGSFLLSSDDISGENLHSLKGGTRMLLQKAPARGVECPYDSNTSMHVWVCLHTGATEGETFYLHAATQGSLLALETGGFDDDSW